jgi:hypothetical protein
VPLGGIKNINLLLDTHGGGHLVPSTGVVVVVVVVVDEVDNGVDYFDRAVVG